MKRTRYLLIRRKHTALSNIFTFRLQTFTYGTASASYLLLRILHQVALNEGSKFPLASLKIMHNAYINIIFFGASNQELCRIVRD